MATQQQTFARDDRRLELVLQLCDATPTMDNPTKVLNFVADAQRLTLDRKLVLTHGGYLELTKRDPVAEWPIDPSFWPDVKQRRVRVAWIVDLARAVVTGHFCGVLATRRTSRITIVGRNCDARVAEVVFMTVLPWVEHIADHETSSFRWQCVRDSQDGPPKCYEKARGFRRKYIASLTARIVARYTQQRTEYLTRRPEAVTRFHEEALAVRRYERQKEKESKT